MDEFSVTTHEIPWLRWWLAGGFCVVDFGRNYPRVYRRANNLLLLLDMKCEEMMEKPKG